MAEPQKGCCLSEIEYQSVGDGISVAEYDFIFVGAGSAGCVALEIALACTQSAKENCAVIPDYVSR
ncbi:MAG: hypothetical protein ACI85H_001046 [Paracoccaceae bacterium]|jgi:hypothetical protein